MMEAQEDKVSAHATIITFESEKEVVMELDFERWTGTKARRALDNRD